MNAINQIQVAVDAIQDRLVLRIATAGNEEIRVFITRRFLREIWTPLAQVCQRLNPPTTPSPDKPADGTAGQGNFDEAFRADNPFYPLGSTPLLASEMTLDPGDPGLCRMILREARERCFTLNLNGELAQALCAMLRAGAGKAAWDLTLDYEATPPVAAPTSSSTHTLH